MWRENEVQLIKLVAVSYNRNAGLALDADFTLMLRRGAHRLVSVLERGAAQAHV